MNGLSRKNVLLIGLMLFSLFFGAGNLIIPPFLGQSAGENTWLAMSTFYLTAVGFPILGVVAVAKSDGLTNLAKRVNPVFAFIFTILIYLSIGPCLGIPRAASLPFELMVAPYLSETISTTLALMGFTVVFFLVAYWLSLSPTKLVNRMGKVLTPTLLVLICVIFVGSLVHPLGSYGNAAPEYTATPWVKGFLDGYLTMDTIAALNFGLVIVVAIQSKGIQDKKTIVSTTIKAGCIAGMLLILIYSLLAHLGATSGGRFGGTENGAQTLTNVVTYIYGKPGAILLAIIFTLACLTTSVGLISSCSQYFASITKKVSYKNWVRMLCLFSMIAANMGLTQILAVSVPVLVAIYPVAIMLIVLDLLDKIFHKSVDVYRFAILYTAIVSVIEALDQVQITLGIVTEVCRQLPWYAEGLGWVIPAFFGIVIGMLVKMVRKIRQNKLVERTMS